MTDVFDKAQSAASYLRNRTSLRPELGLILGSGLGAFASQVEDATAVPYRDIPHFPQSTVFGHSGNLILGRIAGVPVAVMQGRVHAYEGYSLAEVTFPTRVLGLLGCTSLIVTNAAGGINTAYRRGELVLLADHINFTGSNAALGANEPRFAVAPGTAQRFFDMSSAYSPEFRALAIAVAARQGITLAEGVYLAVLGPSFETPAEIRAFRILGADIVGMSTIHEVIVARHMGIKVLGLSLVTNMAAGVVSNGTAAAPELINHEEVMEAGREAENRLTRLLTALIPKVAECR